MKIEHGGNLEEAIKVYGGERSEWIDISTGISPFTTPMPEISLDDWQRLPEPSSLSELAHLAQRYYGADQKCVVTSGSQFVINHLPDLLEGDVGIVEPTYGEYAGAFARQNRHFTSISSIDDIGDVQSIILANPNNPTGRVFSRDELLNLAAKLSARGGYLVVDEAFCDVCDQAAMLSGNSIDNLIVLRSFGKFFGLAGARIGFVFAQDNILHQIEQLQGPWAISGPSMAVAKHVLMSNHIHQDLLKKITTRHTDMLNMLKDTGVEIIGGTKLFMLVGHENAIDLHAYLLKHKILTRKFSYHSKWLRLGLTRDQEEDGRLRDAISSFVDR
ncbi:MAG: threonine-phosphate decarboxylase [Rhizobiaceae bacterium]|nr:threonine-phosphate decarboxylase [Rhizobiaceae bacterium]